MASVTFSIPDQIKKEMNEYSWVNWSELARDEASKRTNQIAWKNEMLKQLSEDNESLRVGGKIKDRMWKRYKKKGW